MKNHDPDLEEFIFHPDTVSMILRNEIVTESFLMQHPYVRLGKILSGGYLIIYLNKNEIKNVAPDIINYSYNIYPIVLTLLGRASLEAAGIIQVHNQPYLDLRGNGVLLGFVDTGIDYHNETFRHADGTSKIRYIWDQTIKGSPPIGYPFGSEYSRERINEALNGDNPFVTVPHRDTVGHGTFLASVAGGKEIDEFIGAAPDAEIIAVKLKQASPFFYERYLVPAWQENAFTSDDVMMGIQYIIEKSLELKRPVAICISLGSNLGGHNGFNTLEEYISRIAGITGIAICAAAGDESQAGHHTQGEFSLQGESQNIEFRVGYNMPDVYISLWNHAADRLSVAVTSPAGEQISRIPARPGTIYQTKLVLEQSEVIVEYLYPVQRFGEQLTRVKVLSATPGIWTITVYGDIVLDGTYHAWLPITGLVDPGIRFLTPTPSFTIVSPATTMGIITCGAFDDRNNSLLPTSSWGPTRLPAIFPDLAAPGANVSGFYPNGFGTMSGTSVAAAITTGASALMLQWGIVERNDISLDSFRLRSNLVAGCLRDPNQNYPNNQWGYGRLNLINSFRSLRPV